MKSWFHVRGWICSPSSFTADATTRTLRPRLAGLYRLAISTMERQGIPVSFRSSDEHGLDRTASTGVYRECE
jgi:hypothetical protein